MSESVFPRSEQVGAAALLLLIAGVGYVGRHSIADNLNCPTDHIETDTSVMTRGGARTLVTSQSPGLTLAMRVDEAGQPSLVAHGDNIHNITVNGCENQEYVGEFAPNTHAVNFSVGPATLLHVRLSQGNEVVRTTLYLDMSNAGAVDGIVAAAAFGPIERGLGLLAKPASPELPGLI